MSSVLAIAAGAVVVFGIVTSWPEFVRYRRIRAM